MPEFTVKTGPRTLWARTKEQAAMAALRELRSTNANQIFHVQEGTSHYDDVVDLGVVKRLPAEETFPLELSLVYVDGKWGTLTFSAPVRLAFSDNEALLTWWREEYGHQYEDVVHVFDVKPTFPEVNDECQNS